jgi:hypothetical protein
VIEQLAPKPRLPSLEAALPAPCETGAEMTNIQLAELFLLRLYDTAEAEGHCKQLLLNKIAAELGISDIMKVHHVAKFLEGRGLIQGRHGLDGGVRAAITGEGAVLLREEARPE